MADLYLRKLGTLHNVIGRDRMISNLKIQGFLIDLDGVIYEGDQLIGGAKEFVEWLQFSSLPFLFLTNNATKTIIDFKKKLERLGLLVADTQIITSPEATAFYLQQISNHPLRLFVIGEIGLRETLLAAGHLITDEAPDYVVVGLDLGFNLQKAETAVKAIRSGAGFIATNPDVVLASEEGPVPGAGALVAAIESEVGIKPTIMGKPFPWLYETAKRQLGLPSENLLMIGDNLATDIVGANQLGIQSALILTGVSSNNDIIASGIVPTYIVNNLFELMTILS